jgi:hypothetical protein
VADAFARRVHMADKNVNSALKKNFFGSAHPAAVRLELFVQ